MGQRGKLPLVTPASCFTTLALVPTTMHTTSLPVRVPGKAVKARATPTPVGDLDGVDRVSGS